MIDFGRLSPGMMPSELPLAPAVPVARGQAAFERALLAPPEGDIATGWPPSDLLLYPFDETRPLGERILDSFARMKAALAPETAALPPPNGVLDNGTSGIDGSRVVIVDPEANGSVTVETDGQGRTIITDPDGSATVIVAGRTSVSVSVASGDGILASLEQLRGERAAASIASADAEALAATLQLQDLMALQAAFARATLP